MKIVQNHNEIFCNPSTAEDFEIVSNFNELKEIDTFMISLRDLEKNESYYHSHAAVFHGWLLSLERSGKNVVVITKNKTVGGVFNFLNSVRLS